MLFTEAKAQPIVAVAERLGLRVYRGFIHCPDHRAGDGVDQHPSASLNPRTNRFRCWSCNNSGDTIDLVGQVLRCSPADAARWLTGQHDLPAPSVLPGTVPEPGYLQEMLEDLIARCGELSRTARRYLEARGIDPAVARRCRVTDVSDYAAVDRGLRERYALQDLIAAGVFSVGGHCRFYRHPLLLPSLEADRPVYLTARRLDSDEEPRYINVNGPVHLYNAGALLEDDPVWITEGMIDCLTLASERHTAVGVIGAFTFKPAWASLFAGRDVILALDADDAGRAATKEIAAVLRAAGATVRIADLPDGTDVNTYYRTTGLVPHVWRTG